jgi:hypothetical protein
MQIGDGNSDVNGALKTSRALAKKPSICSLSVDKVSFSRFSETVGCPGRPTTFKIGSTSYSAVEIQDRLRVPDIH